MICDNAAQGVVRRDPHVLGLTAQPVPELASFIRSGGADRFSRLSTHYINHHNPDLVLLDAGGGRSGST